MTEDRNEIGMDRAEQEDFDLENDDLGDLWEV